jgi:glutamyl/glutaminyl-tRNA synthetase
MTEKQYRGRIAPSPTGLLHIGHAVTFWRAYERACAAGGKLVLRIEDLDPDRCRREFADAIIEDLHWFGLDWDEGPDIGGQFAPYIQSQRRSRYLEAWEKLRLGGLIYPCKCSRKDVVYCRGGRVGRAGNEFAGDTPATTAKRKNSAASDGGSYSDCTKATGSPLAI